jgi:two-component system phosphate regulon sensor histidine kinase PhoR
MSAGWRQEWFLVVPSAVAAGLLGVMLDSVAFALLLPLLIYLSWHLLQLMRFRRWLRQPSCSTPPYMVGIWSEVQQLSEEKRERGRKRKRKLSRMLSGFRESTNALPDATIILNEKGRMEWWNEASKDLLKLDPKNDKGRKVENLIGDTIFRAYLANGDYGRPLQMPSPFDDNITLEVRIVPYGKGKRLLQARDITRLQQLETVRRDFVANVSHEMRTPLTVIHGYLETIRESSDATLGPWQHVVAQMSQQTDRMRRIVEDLLMLSRLEANTQTKGQEEVNVAAILESVRDEAEGLSGGKHSIHLTADPGLWLFGIAGELESAFSNLVFNAVRYTPEGGSVEMHWFVNGKKACFSIKDSGIGIEPEHIPRLTERFYRVDVGRSRQSGGTGLGLAIVKHVLTRHGCHLGIESEPGLGSIFSCAFPEYRVCRMETDPKKRLVVS